MSACCNYMPRRFRWNLGTKALSIAGYSTSLIRFLSLLDGLPIGEFDALQSNTTEEGLKRAEGLLRKRTFESLFLVITGSTGGPVCVSFSFLPMPA